MEKDKFINLIDNFSNSAKLGKWQVFYDTKLDHLYWKKPKLSKDVNLVKLSHETYLYINSKKNIEGVFVEYLKNNFIEHNKKYKGMTKLFNKKVDDQVYTISKKSKKMEDYFDKFSESIKADIYRDAIEDKNTIDDLNFVISTALAR